jgi:hypothetical protein
MNKTIGASAILMSIFLLSSNWLDANHAGPERVVENKYVVVMSLFPEGEEMKLGFIFRDFYTGKNILTPLKFKFSLKEETQATPFFESPELAARNGVGEFSYQFPQEGIYIVSLLFKDKESTETVYRPEPWSIWVPGRTSSLRGRYPIGWSEAAGFLLLAGVLLAIILSIWRKKTKV